ncbi:Chromosome partition protein Smc [Corynebacterium canis]|nr:Chromosome partition protein Smc [Corynebacterium canis]
MRYTARVHLKSLTLKGFKSFASATTLKFEPGICAVVGPNGSGKSNVVDALAWVMGEQGAKTLRGGKMEDVIFAGAGDRKPLGRAEVTLTIDNSDGALPIEYTEVSVTRRMFRDGASEYEINGSRARLMDIQELLSDSGIGREMHIIVGQGRLAQILESRPEERRAFIEEAAGVLKHRRRKEKAQRKLVGMQANLDRLTDLTEELKRQLKPLARQAEAAQRAATVQAELRDARLRLAGDRLVRLATERDDAHRLAERSAAQVAKLSEELEEHSRVQQGLESQLAQVTPEAEVAQALWFELSALAERIVATERIAQDRASAVVEVPYAGQDADALERRADRAEAEQANLDQAVEVARERLDAVREQVLEHEEIAREADREHMAQVRARADRREGVVRLVAAEESQTAQIEAVEADIARQTETLEASLARVDAAQLEARTMQERLQEMHYARTSLAARAETAQSESQAAAARLNELSARNREIETGIARLEARRETLIDSLPAADVGELLADTSAVVDAISVDEGYATAVSAALGAHAHALFVEDFDAEKLASAEVARTVVVAASPAASWRLEAQLPSGARWLLDVIRLDAGIVGPITRLLADVVVVPEVAQAQAVVVADPRLRAVTTNGELFGEGWMAFGRGAATAVEIGVDIARAAEALESLHEESVALSGTLEGATTAANEAQIAAASAQAALRDHDVECKSVGREARRAQAHVDAIQGERKRAMEHVQQATERLDQLKDQLAQIRDRLARVDQHADEEPSTEARDAAAATLSQLRAMEMEACLTLRTAEERAGVSRGQADNLRRQAAQERLNKARHEEQMERRRKQAKLAATVAECAAEIRVRVADATARAALSRDELVARRNHLQGLLSRANEEVNSRREQLGRLTDNAHATDIARHQAQVRIEEAEAKLTEQLGLPAEVIRRDYAPDETFDRAAETKRLRQAERDLAALGKVNPLALEEFTALEERYEYLAGQLADVQQARKDLSDVITEVDAKILQLFTEAWRDVEKQFPHVFATLFPGGEGRLVLTEPEDMLTTGIEVEARPPGKKVKRLSLLSGGEKSLTALAMLVAIFQARPSPFYVMDEVEAALDDVNLRRLLDLFRELRKDSQLIVITHQKPTMEVANVLYGVTMRGDGITQVMSQRMSPA